jgi:hypothetical protein
MISITAAFTSSSAARLAGFGDFVPTILGTFGAVSFMLRGSRMWAIKSSPNDFPVAL